MGARSLYLGALPLQDKNHHYQISALGVTRILAVLEDVERQDTCLHSPVKISTWKHLGIQEKQLAAPDYEAVPLDILPKASIT